MRGELTARLAARRGLTGGPLTKRAFLQALGDVVRRRLRERWIETEEEIRRDRLRRLSYFSAEFLTGRSMGMNLMNLGLTEEAEALAAEQGFSLTDVLEEEVDPGLGNGGLGRLASCFLDSAAALKLPARGYGIRYRYGLFRQDLTGGRQQEAPDTWMEEGDLWGVECPADAREVLLGGRVTMTRDDEGDLHFQIDPDQVVRAVPTDYPVAGPGGGVVMTLRLWEARSPGGFDLALFNRGEHSSAWAEDDRCRSLSAVLYPDDRSEAGKRLRLKQQYFFVSASLQDMTASFRRDFGGAWELFPRQHTIQLNDTHPVLAVPELMRLLMDRERLSWEQAWKIAGETFAYTNHTVLAEALEKWPLNLIREILPRLGMIIEEIQRRLTASLGEGAPEGPRIIRDGLVHMAALAVHGSRSVNGVAALHSEILQTRVLREWYALRPERFGNKTNGITHRRWLLQANPALAELIDGAVGQGWRSRPEELGALAPFARDGAFLEALGTVKERNKEAFREYMKRSAGIVFSPEGLFDFQVKRFHEYKRQLLNIFNVIHRYLELRENSTAVLPPRTFFLGGKAAPGYFLAKEIIRLACRVGETLERDPLCRGRLGLIFLPDYRVSLGEKIFPAAEVSQQISTAGKEASGTGNMKFMMNGALTLGTMDGANIEIFEKAGRENGFPFGLDAREAAAMGASYRPEELISRDRETARIFEALEGGLFGPTGEWEALLGSLRREDPYLVLPELQAHREALRASDEGYARREEWLGKSVKNIAASGYFSSDRTVGEYNRDIWHLTPLREG